MAKEYTKNFCEKNSFTSSRAATVCRHCDMRETNVDVVGESTSSRLSSTNSETLINPGMATVYLPPTGRVKMVKNKQKLIPPKKERKPLADDNCVAKMATFSSLFSTDDRAFNTCVTMAKALLLRSVTTQFLRFFLVAKFFCFSYPLVTSPTSESAESTLTIDAAARFDTVMAELLLSLLFYFETNSTLLSFLSQGDDSTDTSRIIVTRFPSNN